MTLRAPVIQRFYPLPAIAFEQPERNLALLSGPQVGPPRAQRDWPLVPNSLIRLDYVWNTERSAALLAGPQTLPASHQYDWPLAPPLPRLIPWQPNPVFQGLLVPPMPFAQHDWPLITLPKIDYVGFSQRSAALLAGPQNLPASHQYDWPTPLKLIPIDYVGTWPRSLALLSGPQMRPLSNYDQPPPLPLPKIDYAPFQQTFLGLRIIIPIPFSQTDWPLPIPIPVITPLAVVPPSPALLSGPQLMPAGRVTDWPLPYSPPRVDYAPAPPYNLALLSFTPPTGGYRLKIMTNKTALSWDSDFPSGG